MSQKLGLSIISIYISNMHLQNLNTVNLFVYSNHVTKLKHVLSRIDIYEHDQTVEPGLHI